MPTKAMSINKAATKACTIPTTKACLPIVFSSSSLNSLPIEKAIKPKATSETIDSFSTSSKVKKPTPSIFNCPKTYGPTIIPAIKYAVTAGNLKIFKTLVISNPAKIAIDKDNIIFINNPL